jgi:hypothetical protein
MIQQPSLRPWLILAMGFLSGGAQAQALLTENFESGLGQWAPCGMPMTGIVVPDPLRPGNHVLSFAQTNHGSDTCSIATFGPGVYRLSFEYLGLAQPGSVPGDFGGTIGSGSLISTTCNAGIQSCVLIDDGQWHSYVMRFTWPSGGRLVLEDWDHFGTSLPPGVPGDVFFDNLVLQADTVYGTVAYGGSTPGCVGPLSIAANTTPAVGAVSLRIVCTGASPGSVGLFVAGPAPAAASIPILGADFWIAMPSPWLVSVFVLANVVGTGTFSEPIPANPNLRGVRLYEQFLWLGPASPPPCPSSGISASPGLEVVVQ